MLIIPLVRRVPFLPLTKATSQTRWSHYLASAENKKTLPALFEQFQSGDPLVTLTAHDAISARIADAGGVDIILVGDSLAMVAMGHSDTTQVTLDDMIYHCRAVRRGATRPWLIMDLPFGSYERGPQQAMESTVKAFKSGHAEMVKFEGGSELVPTVRHLTQYGMPCIPHIGLTPQRQVSTGGFRVQGRSATSALKLLEDATALVEAGAPMLLLEGVPGRIGAQIQQRVDVPIIGIGAGSGTAGQVLVQLDMLGAFDAFKPRFLKHYASMLDTNTSAISTYASEVRNREFPGPEHIYKIQDAELEEFVRRADVVAPCKR